MKYHVRLIVSGMDASFDTEDIEKIEREWNKDGKICIIGKSGKRSFHDLSMFNIMEITEND